MRTISPLIRSLTCAHATYNSNRWPACSRHPPQPSIDSNTPLSIPCPHRCAILLFCPPRRELPQHCPYAPTHPRTHAPTHTRTHAHTHTRTHAPPFRQLLTVLWRESRQVTHYTRLETPLPVSIQARQPFTHNNTSPRRQVRPPGNARWRQYPGAPTRCPVVSFSGRGPPPGNAACR